LHVDALWHRRKQAQSDHVWLRQVLIQIAHNVFKRARL
jgi:hypothetical protein